MKTKAVVRNIRGVVYCLTVARDSSEVLAMIRKVHHKLMIYESLNRPRWK